jgi:hypothetical protein
MAKNTIAPGRKVQFDPFETQTGYGIGDVRYIATGTVVKVYPEHRWFSVAYGNPVQRISFKFCDVGERVKFVG